MSKDWLTETLHPGYGQSFEITGTLAAETTPFQDLAIYQTRALGRVLMLDGIVQTTEVDEFYYHEMMAHLPIVAHGAAKRVLIIGGGDGGTLREVLKHSTVEQATLVEIDQRVVALSKEHLPTLSAGAFDDPRTQLVIADGKRFVADNDDEFDVIIVDSTDPVGPAVPLFGEGFYRDCAAMLGKRGILIRQAGVPFFQSDEYLEAVTTLAKIFADAAIALAAVPTYCGGHMALAWASNDPGNRFLPPETILTRWAEARIPARYYSGEIHAAAFALPAFMRDALNGVGKG